MFLIIQLCIYIWLSYLCQTELFEMELIMCIKMDLALNNLQRLICYKTQTTNQPNKITIF